MDVGPEVGVGRVDTGVNDADLDGAGAARARPCPRRMDGADGPLLAAQGVVTVKLTGCDDLILFNRLHAWGRGWWRAQSVVHTYRERIRAAI